MASCRISFYYRLQTSRRTAVHVHERDVGEHLVPGVAAGGLAEDAAGRIIGAGHMTPLAPVVVGKPLDHHAGLIGDGRIKRL